jgi:hypothetical protein
MQTPVRFWYSNFKHSNFIFPASPLKAARNFVLIAREQKFPKLSFLHLSTFRYWFVACCVVALSACDGGSGGNSGALPFAFTGTTAPAAATAPDAEAPRTETAGLPPASQPPAVEVPPAQPVPVFCRADIDAALQTGDSTGLSDAPAIARCASDFATKLSARQEALPLALYGNESSAYIPGKSSQFVMPANIETSQPFVVGDKGSVLASVSTAANGRSAAYGTDILDWFRDDGNIAHAPAFRRLQSWLLQGDAGKALPESVSVSFSGIDARSVSAGFVKAGMKVVATACDFSAPDGCDNGAQLLVLGSGVPDDPALEARVAKMLASGKPILYLHTTGWGTNEASRKMLAAMGMVLGGYGGNYFGEDGVAAGRSVAANSVALSQLAKLMPLLRRMAAGDWRTNYDWSACANNSCDNVPDLQADVLTPAETLRNKIDGYTSAGRSLFTEPGTTLYRLLALWGDAARLNIKYPMDKATQAGPLQQAAVADSLIAYVRPKGGAQPDLGTFMNGAASRFAVSSTDEVITLPLPSASGFTTMGRFAIPGKAVAVQVIDAGGATLSLRINTQRTGSTRLWSDNGYDRPRFLASPEIALSAQASMQVVSPYGGTVLLSYAGATPGTSVRLRVRGVAQHPFLDMGNGGDMAAFAQSIQNTPFDWAEIKLPGAEIHTRIDKMKEALKEGNYGTDMARYLTELRSLIFEDAYQLAGFAMAGHPPTTGVLDFCKAQGWDCTDTALHSVPSVQHINADLYAHCGSGCSGNPIDLSWGVGPRGWGESHELGHNLQKGMFNIYGGRSGEVSNNIFPLHKKWRIFRELNVVDADDNSKLAYRSAFDMIMAARAEADPVKGAYNRIWGSDAYAVQNGERMAFYIQWVHYWEQRTGDQTRGWELITQLYLHQRLFEKGDWARNRAKLGYGNYAARPEVNGNDNLLIALSWMTERDQRPTFDLWGVTYSPEAAAQVASYGFAKEAALFYANRSSADHSTVRKIDMTAPTPAWPF